MGTEGFLSSRNKGGGGIRSDISRDIDSEKDEDGLNGHGVSCRNPSEEFIQGKLPGSAFLLSTIILQGSPFT